MKVDTMFLQSILVVGALPSWHAIFREYSVSVPSVLQCFGHPGNILKENIFKESSQWKSCFLC